ncbi:hypothetical protein [Stratiformator vulcanicus]|uniref:Uncharacterized protein n=1 Tax=Stratiformator vulcanicus TaxID=2527980 RepID=A0A517QWG6_9PLAN|nr:hypothetical protein [Stratiformator vulcanicus]QDT36012.1 hypothetical protein Pan189_03670 [Stratiformator vulcanicus]
MFISPKMLTHAIAAPVLMWCAGAADAGSSYTEAYAGPGSNVMVANRSYGNADSRMYASASNGGIARGQQIAIGHGNGRAKASMNLQSIGGQSTGDSFVEAGHGSFATGDTRVGSFYGAAEGYTRSSSNFGGHSAVRTRSYSRFGHTDVTGCGKAIGNARTTVNSFGQSFSPLTYSFAKGTSIGLDGGSAFCESTTRSIGFGHPAWSQSVGISRARGWGSRSSVHSTDFSIGY